VALPAGVPPDAVAELRITGVAGATLTADIHTAEAA
jgi:hypothetical protein